MGEFCIIEGPDTLQDFARMQLEEIRDNIDSRRNRIFLLMEEVLMEEDGGAHTPPHRCTRQSAGPTGPGAAALMHSGG